MGRATFHVAKQWESLHARKLAALKQKPGNDMARLVPSIDGHKASEQVRCAAQMGVCYLKALDSGMRKGRYQVAKEKVGMLIISSTMRNQQRCRSSSKI